MFKKITPPKIKSFLSEKNIYIIIFEIFLIIWGLTVYVAYPWKIDLKKLDYIIKTFFLIISNIKISAFFKILFPLVFILFFISLAFLIGRSVMRIFGIELKPRQNIVTNCGLGIGILSYLMFFLGIFGLWYSEIITIVLVLLYLILIRYNIDLITKDYISPVKSRSTVKYSVQEKATIFFIFCFMVIAFLGAMSPEIFYDSLVYHLSLPNLYLINHRIIPTYQNLFSGMPFFTEMLYGLAMSMSGIEAAKLIHYMFGILVLCVIRSFTSHGFSRKSALLAFLIFCSAPMVLLEFMRTAVELSWTFFVLLALLHILNLFDSPEEKPFNSCLIIAGIFSGFAMSIKYPAWFMFPVLIVLVYFIGRKKQMSFSAILRKITLFTIIIIILISPWALKNIFHYKNPVYPFFNDYIAGSPRDDPDWRSLKGEAGGEDIIARFSSMEGLKNYFIYPWQLTMEGISDSDFIGAVFLFFLPWLFYPGIRPQRNRPLLYFFIGFWFLLSLTATCFRFFIPLLAVLSILLSVVICELSPRYLRNFAFIMILLLASHNFCYTYNIWFQTDAWMVFTGQKNRDVYLVETHKTYPAPYYQTAVYVNNLPINSKILIVGDARGLYYKRDYNASSVFDKQHFLKLLEKAKGSESFYNNLKKEGFTHVLFNIMEIYRLIRNCDQVKILYENVDDTEISILKEFWNKYLEEVNIEYINLPPKNLRFVILYKLLSLEEANQPHKIPQNYFLPVFDKLKVKAVN